jgi:hypothetical protein
MSSSLRVKLKYSVNIQTNASVSSQKYPNKPNQRQEVSAKFSHIACSKDERKPGNLTLTFLLSRH